MSYKPDYCCQCGVKIERSEWKMWTNRRFCKLCETDHVLDQFKPYIKGIGAAFVILLIGFYFQKPEKPLTVASNQSVGGGGNRNSAANQFTAAANTNVPPTMQSSGETTAAKMSVMLKASDVKAKPTANPPAETPEKIYFCGAETKKGAPCSRRVKGGGRCWQHVGQAAMMAQEKLIAVQ